MDPDSRKRTPRWRRLALRALLLLGIVIIVAPAALVLGLRSASVRQAIVARLDRSLEATGLSLAIDDFTVRLTSGQLDIENLRLVTREGRVFVSVPRAQASIRLRSVLGQRLVIRSVRVEDPFVDLSVSLPQGQDSDGSASMPAIDVGEIVIVGGHIASGPLAETLEPLLDRVTVRDLSLQASYVDDELDVTELSAAVEVESSRREPIEMTVATTLSASLDGAAELERLAVHGAGLELNASGRSAGLATGASEVSFELDANVGQLFPDLTEAGRVAARGQLSVADPQSPVLTGPVALTSSGFPAELLAVLLPEAVRTAIRLNESWIEAEADLDLRLTLPGVLDALEPDAFDGQAHATWREADRALVTVSVGSIDTPPTEYGIRVGIEAQLLPEDAGRRRVTAELRAPGWLRALEGRLEGAQLEVAEPNLETLPVRARLDPDLLEAWTLAGKLEVEATADGPLANPSFRLTAGWSREGERLVAANARSLPAPGSVAFAYDVAVLPGHAGRRELDGEVIATEWTAMPSAELRKASVLLQLPSVEATVGTLDRLAPALLPRTAKVSLQRLTGGLTAELRAEGPITTPRVEIEADWQVAEGEVVTLDASGTPSPNAPYLAGQAHAELVIDNLDLARVPTWLPDMAPSSEPSALAGLEGRAGAALRLEGSTDSYRATLTVDASGLALDDRASIDRVRLEAETDGAVVRLTTLTGSLSAPAAELTDVEFEGRAEIGVAKPVREATAWIEIRNPAPGIDLATAGLELRDGAVHVDPLEITYPGGNAHVDARLPLGALGLASAEIGDWLAVQQGPMSLNLHGLEIGPLVPRTEALEGVAIDAVVDGSIRSAGWRLTDLTGHVQVAGLAAEMEDAFYAGTDTLDFAIGDGAITLQPAEIRFSPGRTQGSTSVAIQGQVQLDPDWEPEAGAAALVRGLVVETGGTVNSGILTPFIPGGVAAGDVHVQANASGDAETLTGKLGLEGPDASLRFRSPYATRLEAPEIELTAREGEVTVDLGRAILNGGPITFTGGWKQAEGLQVHVAFDDVRYRLDHGVIVLVAGDIDLSWPAVGRRRLGGDVIVKRASLRRNVALEREALRAIFGETRGGSGIPSTIDLALNVSTEDGLYIRNNLADLHASWNLLRITGTAAAPLVTGQLDVDPGGLLFVPGQVMRVDQASFEWSGQPIASPRIIFDHTSSLDDPSIAQRWKSAWFNPADAGPGAGGGFWQRGTPDEGREWETVAAGLSQYYTDRLYGAAGGMRTELSYEPLPLFGETQNQARFTVSQHLSRNATIILSTNPRETESRTYILDLHEFWAAPSLRGQAFHNDQGNPGMTVQQTITFGGRGKIEDRGPTLGAIAFQGTADLSTKRLRRSIQLRKGDPFPDGAQVEVEMDVSDRLRRKGYPDSQVEVQADTGSSRAVNLTVDVETGPKVEMVFEGEKLSRGARRAIAALYVPSELGELEAQEEVRVEALRALRSNGFLEPQVEVTVSTPLTTGPKDPDRIVTVKTDGGRRIEPGPVVIEGLADEEEAALISGQFVSTLSRVELATELPEGDEHLLRLLAAIGYGEAQIVSRSLSDDGEELIVRVNRGRRARIGQIDIAGVSETERAALAERLQISVGGPARPDKIRDSARAIEDSLRAKGHAEATVTSSATKDPETIAVLFEVKPGPAFHVDAINVTGLHTSRPKWVRRVSRIKPGELLRQEDVNEARRRLYETRVFRSVRATTDLSTEADPYGACGHVDPAADSAATINLQLEEAPRYRLGYGLRWESDAGLGVVVDAVDNNSLRRGHTTGIRANYSQQEAALRLYHRVPRVVGRRSSFEVFLEGRRETVTDIETEILQMWLQLTMPITHRARTRVYTVFEDRSLTDSLDPDIPLDERAISPRLGWQLTYDTVDEILGANRKGLFIGLDLSGSHTSLGADVTSVAAFTQFKLLRPFSKVFNWSQSYQLGTIATEDGVPFVDRLRTGGEFSVRGYPRDSLGPLNDEGVAIGGELLFVMNQEVHFPIWKNLRGLGFFDAGNVWVRPSDFELDLFKASGLGLRYHSPFGPIRLDVAFPLDRREIDPTHKIYVGYANIF